MVTRRPSSDEGFTLIELLIVIAILAVLVSIVALNVTSFTDSAQQTALQVETRLVQLAIDQYNMFDVLSQGAPEINNSGGYVRITPASGTFSKYLSTQTNYYYCWAHGGIDLDGKIKP